VIALLPLLNSSGVFLHHFLSLVFLELAILAQGRSISRSQALQTMSQRASYHTYLEQLVAVGSKYLHEKDSLKLHLQIFEAVSLTAGVLYVQKHKPSEVYLRELD
jgi:hypothetical protein